MERVKRKYYVVGFLILFIVESCIAAFLKSGFIRGNLGDFLVVLLVYCLIMACSHFSVKTGLVSTAVVALVVELLQIIDLTQFFEGTYKSMARLVFGSHFSWLDLLMYALGIVCIGCIEICSSSPLLLQEQKEKGA